MEKELDTQRKAAEVIETKEKEIQRLSIEVSMIIKTLAEIRIRLTFKENISELYCEALKNLIALNKSLREENRELTKRLEK